MSLGARTRKVTEVTVIHLGSAGLRSRCSLSIPLEPLFLQVKTAVLSPAPYFLFRGCLYSEKVWERELCNRQWELSWVGVVFSET